MANTVLKIIVNGEDNASPMLRGLSGLLKGGLVAGAGAAIAGIAGLGAVLKSSVSEAEAAEEVTAQLNAVLKSTKGIAGMTAEALNEQALALSEMTRFEDDEIASASSLLLTFTKVGKDVFPDATEATLDMATALKIDLRSATMMVGKALNDPIRGITTLTRSGIQFTDQQRDMIEAMVEAGDVAGAQRIILAELETQFGGSAQAAGETAAGMRDILGNALGNIKEEIGGALLPVVKDLTLWAGPKLLTAFKGIGQWITGGIEDMREFGGKLGQARDIIGDIVEDVQAGRGIRWTDLFDLAGLFTDSWSLKVKFAEIVQDVESFFSDVKTAYETGGIFAAIDTAVREIGQGLQTFWESIDWEAIKTTLTTYWDTTLQPALKTAWTNLSEWIQTDYTFTEELGTALGAIIVPAMKVGVETSREGMGQALGTMLGEALGGSADGTAFWDAFSKNLRATLTPAPVQNAISSVMDAMLKQVIKDNPVIGTYLDTLREIVTNLREAGTAYGDTRSAFSQGLTNPFEAILRVIRDVISAIREAIDTYWQLNTAFGGNTPKGGGPFSGVQAGVSVSPPAGGGGVPGSGRSAAAGGMVFNITINAPGGDARAVSQAAQTGVLAAARSMGLA